MELIGNLVIAVAVLALLWAALVLALIAAGRRSHAHELATFLPNLVLLFRGLATDPRVPRRAKLVLAAGAAYLALPIDLIPDFIPVVGQLDDAIVAGLVLRYVLSCTERPLVYEHWRGERTTLDRLLSLARA